MIKVMVLLLIAAFAGLFFINGPDGEKILTLDDFKPELPAEEATVSAPEKVYKWQDENGVWQFSNQPRDENMGETVEYDGNINTMPATDTSILSQRGDTDARPGLQIPAGMTSVSGEQAQEMMDTVNNLQSTVDERKAELDRLSQKP
jgi:hypothetical protein